MSSPVPGSDGPAPSHRAVLALGANLGDPDAAMRSAVSLFEADASTHVVAASHLYSSAPIGGPEQPDYVNAVVIVQTTRDPWSLLALAHEVEAAHDRVREQRWGPRTLDVDVIVIDELQLQDGRLTLPHPRAHLRAFVLLPWLELDPEATIPGQGAVADLVAEPHVVAQRIHRMDSQPLVLRAGEGA